MYHCITKFCFLTICILSLPWWKSLRGRKLHLLGKEEKYFLHGAWSKNGKTQVPMNIKLNSGNSECSWVEGWSQYARSGKGGKSRPLTKLLLNSYHVTHPLPARETNMNEKSYLQSQSLGDILVKTTIGNHVWFVVTNLYKVLWHLRWEWEALPERWRKRGKFI